MNIQLGIIRQEKNMPGSISVVGAVPVEGTLFHEEIGFAEKTGNDPLPGLIIQSGPVFQGWITPEFVHAQILRRMASRMR